MQNPFKVETLVPHVWAQVGTIKLSEEAKAAYGEGVRPKVSTLAHLTSIL